MFVGIITVLVMLFYGFIDSVQAPGYTILDRGCGEGVNCPSYEKGQSYGSFEERNYDESKL